MAVDTSALTLAQYALMSNEPLVRAVSWSLIEHGSVLQDIPLVTKKSLVANGVRFQGSTALPTVGWAKINEEPTVVSATPTPFQEQLYLIRNAIDVDRRLVEDENQIQDPRALQVNAYLKSVAYDVNDKFINNSQVTGDSDAPVGIRVRLDNPSLYGVETEMKIDGGAVDLRVANMTAATANSFFLLLDRLLSNMGNDDGNGVVIYVNEDLRRRMAMAVRMLGAGAGWSTDQDNFGRRVERFRGAVVRTIGRKSDQTTQIITSTETTAGVDGSASDDYTSLYAVQFGETACMGWQFEDLSGAVRDLGLLNNGVTYRTVIDWGVGLYIPSTRAIGRIYNILMS